MCKYRTQNNLGGWKESSEGRCGLNKDRLCICVPCQGPDTVGQRFSEYKAFFFFKPFNSHIHITVVGFYILSVCKQRLVQNDWIS